MSKRAIARHFCISRDSVDSSEDQGLIQWINPPTDDRVLRAAGLPADGADQAAEAGRVHRDHRRVAARGRRTSSQAASHREAGPGSPAGGARVHRRLHHREGLLARAPAAQPGDVRAAAPRARPRPGGLRRGDGRHRRGRAEDALFVLDLPHSDAATCGRIRRRRPRRGPMATSMPSRSSDACRCRCSTTARQQMPRPAVP